MSEIKEEFKVGELVVYADENNQQNRPLLFESNRSADLYRKFTYEELKTLHPDLMQVMEQMAEALRLVEYCPLPEQTARIVNDARESYKDLKDNN